MPWRLGGQTGRRRRGSIKNMAFFTKSCFAKGFRYDLPDGIMRVTGPPIIVIVRVTNGRPASPGAGGVRSGTWERLVYDCVIGLRQ